MRFGKSILSLLVIAAVTGLAGTALADQVVLQPTDGGFYNASGTAASTNGNYAAGWFVGGTSEELRNYFVFDLSGINGTITSATLVLGMPQSAYLSPDPTETFSLFDVTTTPATLLNHAGSTAIFNDLGSGTVYGTANLSFTDPAQIPLNGTGLAFLNAHHSPVVLGGAVTSFTAGGPVSEAVFNSTSVDNVHQLVLQVTPVPEPASAVLLGCGVVALMRRPRRR